MLRQEHSQTRFRGVTQKVAKVVGGCRCRKISMCWNCSEVSDRSIVSAPLLCTLWVMLSENDVDVVAAHISLDGLFQNFTKVLD